MAGARFRGLAPTPDVFAAVMATGVLSIAARVHHYTRISGALDVLAVLALVALVALAVATAVAERRLAVWDLTDPDVTLRLFTFVATWLPAGCPVLCARPPW